MRLSRVFLLLAILTIVEETIRLWFVAPAVMASHFNVLGLPDNFVSKATFFSFQIEITLITIALAVVSPILLVILPVELINLPNRAYWLSPDQRPATINRLSSFLEGLFTVTLLVTLTDFELGVSANLRTPIVFNAQLMGLAIAGLFVFTLPTLALLFWSFRLPPSV